MPKNIPRIHKRPFVVFIMVSVGVVLISAGFLFFVQFLAPDTALLRIRIDASEATSTPAGGVGIDLSFIPTANLLLNPSFENLAFCHHDYIVGGGDDYIYIAEGFDPAITYPDDFFVGGQIRILSINEDGEMIKKYKGPITSYLANQLAFWKKTSFQDLIENDINRLTLADITSSPSMTVAVTQEGHIIGDLLSETPFVVERVHTKPWEALGYAGEQFFAVARDGYVAFSSDGKIWHLTNPPGGRPARIRAATALGRTVIAYGDRGCVYVYAGGTVFEASPGVDDHLLSAASDGDVVLVGTDKGQLLTTSNGFVYRLLTQEERDAFDKNVAWEQAQQAGGIFAVGSSDGYVGIGTVGKDGRFAFSFYETLDANNNRLVMRDMLLLPTGVMLMTNEDRSLYRWNQTKKCFEPIVSERDYVIDHIASSSFGEIIFVDAFDVYLTSINTQVGFEQTSGDIALASGDLCILEHSFQSAGQAVDLPWKSFNEQTAISTMSDAPAGAGERCLRMRSDDSDEQTAHVISQKIGTGYPSFLKANQVYKIELWLRQNDIDSQEVMVWISGLGEPVGTTLTNVGNGWRQYAYSFVPSASMLAGASDDIRLNIGFYGQGELFLDQVYFGSDRLSSEHIAPDVESMLSQIRPPLTRISHIHIGQKDCLPTSFLFAPGNETGRLDGGVFYGEGITSLETALRLVREAESNPWFVIGPYATQTEIDALFGYLCASISDPYGRARIDNGTSVPWRRQFNRLVIEISDEDGMFLSDIERGAYVDYVINMVQSTAYYLDVKDMLIFVDAMTYIGGRMLSDADYHATNLSLDNRVQETGALRSFDHLLTRSLRVYHDRIPRVPYRSVDRSDEWMAPFDLRLFEFVTATQGDAYRMASVSLAQYVHALLIDMGVHTSYVVPSLVISRDPTDIYSNRIFSESDQSAYDREIQARNQTTLMRAVTLISDLQAGQKLTATILPPVGSDDSLLDTIFDKDDPLFGWDQLEAHAFLTEDKLIVIAVNLGQEPVVFIPETPWPLQGATAERYAADGTMTDTEALSRRNNRINLLPGHVVVINIPVGDK